MFRVEAFRQRRVDWWYTNRRSLNLRPAYQRRGGIWTLHTRRRLIDSILNQYDLPKFYIADLDRSSGFENVRQDEPFAVIDGRQRFEAIFEFYRDGFDLDTSVQTSRGLIDLRGLTYSRLALLHPELAARLDNFELSIMAVITDEPIRINELFVRLNSSAPLNGAEVRNAMPGVVPPLIRELAQHEFFESRVRFSTIRAQDQNTCAKLLVTEFNGDFVDVKKRNLDIFVRSFDDEKSVNDAERESANKYDRLSDSVVVVQRVLNQMASGFRHHDPLLSAQGPVIEYYWLYRSHPEADPSWLRNQLEIFDELRLEAIGIPPSRVSRSHLDLYEALITYNDKRRNANDREAIRIRYSVLAEWLGRLPVLHPRGIEAFFRGASPA